MIKKRAAYVMLTITLSGKKEIESLNSTYRKINRQKSVFPSDKALLKALYLYSPNFPN